MHWKKNRIVNPSIKHQIIQRGECPGCGVIVKFYYGEGGQFCGACRKEAEASWRDEVAERISRRTNEKIRNR